MEVRVEWNGMESDKIITTKKKARTRTHAACGFRPRLPLSSYPHSLFVSPLPSFPPSVGERAPLVPRCTDQFLRDRPMARE